MPRSTGGGPTAAVLGRVYRFLQTGTGSDFTGMFMYVNKRKLKGQENAVRCPIDTGHVQESACVYCVGRYARGIHRRCPHCGAPISHEKVSAFK